jgi:hypothetical protein
MTRGIVITCVLAVGHAGALAQPDSKPETAPGMQGDKTGNLQHGAEIQRPWAKGVSKDNQAKAVERFSEGNGHLNDGIFMKAVETYREALTFWDHPAIHYNMALALTKLDRPIDVEIHLEKAIEFGPDPLETPDKFEHAKEYLVLNAKQLAWIDVSCDKLGAKVSIDGKEVFTVEAGKPNRYEGRVTVGKHTIVAEKTGYNAQVDAPYIEPGQKFRIELKLYTSDELTRYRRRWDTTWMPYAVLGSAVLLGGGAALLEQSAQSSYDKFDAEIARCNEQSGGTGCMVDASISKLRDSGDTKRTLGYVGYGLAGAAVITGAVLVYLNREVRYEITADEYRREQARKQKPVAITPLVGPGTAGAMLFGRF